MLSSLDTAPLVIGRTAFLMTLSSQALWGHHAAKVTASISSALNVKVILNLTRC